MASFDFELSVRASVSRGFYFLAASHFEELDIDSNICLFFLALQGLLNSYFSTWSMSPPTHRLPFVYNMAANVTYSYLPAFKKFGQDVKVCHFLGRLKLTS